MAEAAPITNAQTEVDEPQSADWRHWRQRGYCRLWQAAMLTMNLEPTKANRRTLQAKSPDADYAEFLRRKEVLTVRYGFDDRLTPLNHPREGELPGDRYVELAKIIELAKEIGWPAVETWWNAAFSNTSATQPTDPGYVHPMDEESDGEELENSRTIVLGSLLDVFERSLRGERFEIGDGKNRKTTLVKGKEANLNHSDLAKLMIKAIDKRAEQQNGFGFQNIHKQLTTASKAFKKTKNNRA
jgi:hypothetical protein